MSKFNEAQFQYNKLEKKVKLLEESILKLESKKNTKNIFKRIKNKILK